MNIYSCAIANKKKTRNDKEKKTNKKNVSKTT